MVDRPFCGLSNTVIECHEKNVLRLLASPIIGHRLNLEVAAKVCGGLRPFAPKESSDQHERTRCYLEMKFGARYFI